MTSEARGGRIGMTSEAREGRLGDAFIAWSLGKLVYLNRGKGKSVPRPTCGILLFGYTPRCCYCRLASEKLQGLACRVIY